jgi:NAD(P)-dependent dehydrogenase (short-subunit alcohol dehydrogenase family)
VERFRGKSVLMTGGTRGIAADLERVDASSNFARKARNVHGGLDVLVNNAGFTGPADPDRQLARRAA